MKKVIKKVLCSLMDVTLLFVSFWNGSNQPLIGNNTIAVSAENVSDELTSGDLTYKKYDDHIEITDCDESAVSVDIPGEIEELPVTLIGYRAFWKLGSLTSVTIPDSVTRIDEEAFRNCTALTSITIPGSVKTIDSWAFWGCSSLADVTISEGVTSIGPGAFWDCTSLTNIDIPGSVEGLGYDVFLDCANLTDINVSANNEFFSSVDGVLFNKGKTELIVYPRSKKAEVYTVPKSVRDLGTSAFSECPYLKSVILPDGLVTIGYYSFALCENLTSITIPKNVTTVARYAFTVCANLKEITFEGTETLIEEGVVDAGGTISNKNDYYVGVIRGYANSRAKKYAKEKGYKFEALDKIPGDLSKDGTIDFLDLVQLSKLLLPGAKISNEQIAIADLDGNGKLDFLDLSNLAKELIKNAK